jgi:2-polyprenyl-6-hydroxyphenyl methylase/3-demethylubiquinone-9 3-methyltransferase
VYYDHEPAYRRIASQGGRSWDDLSPSRVKDAYVAVDAFLESSFAPPAGARALELGCGGGQVAFRLARRGYVAAGVDFSETAIELAKRNARESQLDVAFFVDDCLHLRTQKDASFGLVVDNHALHCIVRAEDRAAFLSQAFRVLEPGGVFFTETMSCETGFDPKRFDADPATRVARNGTRIWVSAAELDRELAAAGFRLLFSALRSEEAEGPGVGPDLIRYAERPRDR